MPFFTFKCKAGHKFRSYSASQSVRVQCPQCRDIQESSRSIETSEGDGIDPRFPAAHYQDGRDLAEPESRCTAADSPSDSFSSGGGGDFGGGGASGDF